MSGMKSVRGKGGVRSAGEMHEEELGDGQVITCIYNLNSYLN